MTPEKLVELLRDPRVTGELEELLRRPALRRHFADLLDAPQVTEKLGQLLANPDLQGALAPYFKLALAGGILLAALGVVTLAVALYNGALLRRTLRELGR